jgi:hypothetical protein
MCYTQLQAGEKMKKYFSYQIKKALIVQSLITIESLDISAHFTYPEEVHDFHEFAYIDSGTIECRFMDTELVIAGYEPFTFLCGGLDLAKANMVTAVTTSASGISLTVNGSIFAVGDNNKIASARLPALDVERPLYLTDKGVLPAFTVVSSDEQRTLDVTCIVTDETGNTGEIVIEAFVPSAATTPSSRWIKSLSLDAINPGENVTINIASVSVV